MPRTLRVAVLTGLLAFMLAGTSQADEPVVGLPQSTAVRADAGVAAWIGSDGRLVVRYGDNPPEPTRLRLPGPFDVGPLDGAAQVVWTAGCSPRRRRCAVRRAVLREGRAPERSTLSTIPWRPRSGHPAIAVEEDQLAYARSERFSSRTCDVPYLRRLGGKPRRMDRGRCGNFFQLDLERGALGLLASTANEAFGVSDAVDEARLIAPGDRRSDQLLRLSQGENAEDGISAIAMDHGGLWLGRLGGFHNGSYVRYDVKTRKPQTFPAFAHVENLAVEDHRVLASLLRQGPDEEGGCGLYRCLLVALRDPLQAPARLLAPDITFTVSPDPPAASEAATLTASVTQAATDGSAITASEPVAGAAVSLKPFGGPAGPAILTDAAGQARFTLPPPLKLPLMTSVALELTQGRLIAAGSR